MTVLNVRLPKSHIFETPRYLQTDAYTVGSDTFQSPEARRKSIYYSTFRRAPWQWNPDLYEQGDDRIIYAGPRRINERLFRKPMDHVEIDNMKEFLATFKVTQSGLAPYQFPEELLRRTIDEFNGRPPIQILGFPEGSVVYPNEPNAIYTSLADGFGELAAWFEAVWLQTWGPSEAATQAQHWFKWLRAKIQECDITLTPEQLDFFASIQLTDMGARGAFNVTETEDLGISLAYAFPGTDSLAAAYQVWMDSGKQPVCNSVLALAHRNVQAYKTEQEVYEAMFNVGINDELLSMVNDAYASKRSVNEMQIPLAIRSQKEGRNIIIVSRADSGDPYEQIMQIIDAAKAAGLYTTQEREGKTWYYPTTMHYIEADGMTFTAMKTIINKLSDAGIAWWAWGLFGSGGGLRNGLKRDNTSHKFALCACGPDDRPVVKFSETLGKTTLPGPFKVVRTEGALARGTTIRQLDEPGESAMVEYFNGLRLEDPFGPGMDDDFPTIKARIAQQMRDMPKSLRTDKNHGYPASEAILALRQQLLAEYAPDKEAANY